MQWGLVGWAVACAPIGFEVTSRPKRGLGVVDSVASAVIGGHRTGMHLPYFVLCCKRWIQICCCYVRSM